MHSFGLEKTPRIGVVIPAYRCASALAELIPRIGAEVERIYVVDDACPEKTGERIQSLCKDPRVEVIFHPQNQGVGGAVKTGYRRGIAEGMHVLVKLDGDGQMDPALLPSFVAPILRGEADYTKGNRFFRLDSLAGMPALRLVGNAALSLLTKVSSGYYPIFDPTNGYTAVHTNILRAIPLDKIASRYFFESDMLFRLYTVGAVVADIPMDARYADERSSLKVGPVIPEFLFRHGRNFAKRIFYNYFLRDFNPASVQLILGALLLVWGAWFGISTWLENSAQGVLTPPGTVMVAVLPVVLGAQLLLSFLNYDFQNVPRRAVHDGIRYPAREPDGAAQVVGTPEYSKPS